MLFLVKLAGIMSASVDVFTECELVPNVFVRETAVDT